jgi:RecB family exonuclease
MAGTGLRDKRTDLTAGRISKPELADAVLARLCNGEETLRVSPTNLDIWNQCRFRFLLGRALHLEEAGFDTVFSDPRESGILFHRLLAKALRMLDESDDMETEEGRAKSVAQLLRSVLTPWFGPRFLPPVRNDMRRRAEHYLLTFLEAERRRFPGARLYTVEDTLEVAFDSSKMVLYGRIDRISEQDGGYIVVDYKTRLWAKRAGMVTTGGELYSFQVPLYLLLVEGSYGEVSEALYYDIDKGSYDSVFGGEKPWFDEAEREDLLRQTKRAISQMYRSVVDADFETPRPKGGCNPCEFRPVCREKYRVR